MNKLLPKIIFYTLIVAVAVAGTLLYMRMQPAAISQNATPTSATATCIITIDGQKYDVASLRNTHTGGDVFQCGTDMSAVFHGKHGNNLQMIQQYLIK
jgi:hypothetical protein